MRNLQSFKLDLKNSRLDDFSIQKLEQLIQKIPKSVYKIVLNFQNTGITDKFVQGMVTHLQNLSRAVNLKLVLAGNSLQRVSTQQVVRLFAELRTLGEIHADLTCCAVDLSSPDLSF